MKTFLRFSLLTFFLMGFAGTNLFAQTFREKVEHQIDSVNAARAKLSKDEQKISTPIYNRLIDYESTKAAGRTKAEAFQAFNRSSIITDNSYRIYVDVSLLPTNSEKSSVQAVIEANGGSIHSSGTYTITCWIPADVIRTIAALPSVTMIEQFYPPMTN